MLTPEDLSVLLRLVVRADLKVGDVPQVWPSIQRLEAAVKSGVPYRPVYLIDAPESPGGSD